MTRSRCALALLLLLPSRALAQQTDYERAFDLERRGSFAAAADLYRQVLRSRPSDAGALLGYERVMTELGRAAEVAPLASAALLADSTSPVLFGAAVRAWTAAGQADSTRRLVARWSALEPGSEAPFREWGFAALELRDRAGARRAYLAGRDQIGTPEAMSSELAQLAALDGDFAAAAIEWRRAVRAVPGYRSAAIGQLSATPLAGREEILSVLATPADAAGGGLAAGLSARWGAPLRGVDLLFAGLPGDSTGRRMLREYLEDLRPMVGGDAARARGRVLEALADRTPADAPRWLADAARAYADAGDEADARRVLARLAADPGTAPAVATSAAVTLVSVLVAEGRLDEAGRRLSSLADAIPEEEAERLRHLLARGYLRAGRLPEVAGLVATDSTTEGLGLRGRARLLQGDLAGAAADFAAAGPYAEDRGDATDRAFILALLQVMDDDSLPALGEAFMKLERGDSAAAALQFAAVAGRLPPARGGAELLLLAGRLEAARNALAEAEELLRSAAGATTTAAAPAAQLELARLLVRSGRSPDAVPALEQLILDHPGSAVAPQARRLLDAVRGGVPPA